MPPPIAILGAGPSGLMLGRLLELANIDYLIFERSSTPHEATQGGSLDIHAGTGQLAIQEAALFEQFKTLIRYDSPSTIADKNGKVAASYAPDSNGGETDRPEIDRKDLRELLLRSIPEERVRWGKRVQRLSRNEGHVQIHFEDGQVLAGSPLVVGADGAWSKARSLVTAAVPEYSGILYMTTLVQPSDEIHAAVAILSRRGTYMALGNEKEITAQRNGDDSYTIGVGLRAPADWHASLDGVRSELVEKHFAGWAPAITDLVSKSHGDFRTWPLYAMPPEALSWKSAPSVTLIGDAAHLTMPFEGEGVNCALFDSLQLAQQIRKHGLQNLNQAVSEYEQEMLPRGADLIRRSAVNGELLFAQDAPDSWTRAYGRGDA